MLDSLIWQSRCILDFTMAKKQPNPCDAPETPPEAPPRKSRQSGHSGPRKDESARARPKVKPLPIRFGEPDANLERREEYFRKRHGDTK
jgi:hypothetical protein